MSVPKLNDRVRHADTLEKATVRFLGEIPVTNAKTCQTTNQTFYGIEYDRIGAGKYDGSYNGVQYFTTKSAKAGFVKVNKLTPPTSLLDIIKQKYLLDRQAEAVMQLTDGQLNKDVNFVGIDQVDRWHRDIQRMPALGFEGANVWKIDDFDGLSNLIPSCESLDLADNLIDDINSAIKLFSCLKGLELLNLDANKDMHLRLLTQETIDLLKNAKGNKQLSINLKKNVTSNEAQIRRQILQDGKTIQPDQEQSQQHTDNEIDFNVLCQLQCISSISFNDRPLDKLKLLNNEYLTSISLTGSIQFQDVTQLRDFLQKFPNLTQFTTLDALTETYETDITTQKPQYVSKLEFLNLAESALSYDSLDYLFDLAPNLSEFKILKVYHSKLTNSYSIFQTDQVAPLIAGCFYQTMKKVNGYEIRKKYLPDYQTFYIKYFLANNNGTLNDRQIEQIIKSKFWVPKQLVSDEQMQKFGETLIKLNLLTDNQEDEAELTEEKTESQVIEEKYHGRIMKVYHGDQHAESFLVTVQTPVWKFQAQLQKMFGENKRFVLQLPDMRRIDLSTVRFTNLLEDLREYLCYLQVQEM